MGEKVNGDHVHVYKPIIKRRSGRKIRWPFSGWKREQVQGS